MVLITAASDSDSGDPHRPSTAANHHHPQSHHHNNITNNNKNNINNNNKKNYNSLEKSMSSFTSLPCFNIKWGNQKSLRCVKDTYQNELTRSEFDSVDGRKRRRSNDNGDIKAMREKIMLDFKRQAAQIQATFLNNSSEIENRPWNLRTRRAVCKDPNNNNNVDINSGNNNGFNGNSSNNGNNNNNGFLLNEKKGSFLQTLMAEGNNGEGRVKFKRCLLKQEIEEDFVKVLGVRPVRRPKKRPRIVQRQIDAITPGFWLSEITADMYKVNEQV